MAADDDVIRAWANLHLAHGAMRKLLDDRLRAEAECSLSDHDVLTELDCAPDQRLQMLALAARLGVSRGGLTRIIDRLVDSGWVSRDRPARNRREVYAVLTEDGSHKLRQARAVYVGLLTQILGAHLDDAALTDLATSTGTLLKALTSAHPG